MSLVISTIIFLAVVALEIAIEWLQDREDFGASLPPVDLKGILEENYHPCEVDVAMLQQCADLLEHLFPTPEELPIGERIDQKMQSMTSEQRMEFLQRIVVEAAHVMKVNIKEIRFEDIAGYGCYRADSDAIVISKAYIEMEGQVVEVVKTVFHELKHAVQFHAITTGGNIRGYPREMLIEWANNFQYYINPTWDPEGYFYQPLEIDAFGFENTLIPTPVLPFKYHVV